MTNDEKLNLAAAYEEKALALAANFIQHAPNAEQFALVESMLNIAAFIGDSVDASAPVAADE